MLRPRWATLAACSAGLFALTAFGASSAGATDTNDRYTAEEVHHFLEGFYGDQGPRPWERENLVTEELKKRAAETEGYDLLLCARNVPLDIEVGEVTTAQSAGVGWAMVETSWGEGEESSVFAAYVSLDGDQPLKLLDIDCNPSGV